MPRPRPSLRSKHKSQDTLGERGFNRGQLVNVLVQNWKFFRVNFCLFLICCTIIGIVAAMVTNRASISAGDKATIIVSVISVAILLVLLRVLGYYGLNLQHSRE